MRRRLVSGLMVMATVVAGAAGARGTQASVSSGPGSQLWVARYKGPSIGGDAYSVAVSPGGRTVFVTGHSAGTDGDVDYATVACNAVTGARLWAARYDGPGHAWNAASTVAVSPGGGSVFVTGVSQGKSSGLDYATVAYNAATGAQLWVKRYNGPGNGDDGATAMEVSPSGKSVFVTGYSQGKSTGLDYATVAYNAATGAQLWVARYTGPGKGDDYAQALAVSPGGQTVYVTGDSKETASTDDYATVAYNAATGAQRWAMRYHGPAPGNDAAHSVAVSPSGGTVYVTGGSKASSTFLDYSYATVAYNAATGAQEWVARYNGPVKAYDPALSVAVSPSGRTVFVTGQSEGATSGDDYATVAYNAATGTQLWVRRYNGSGNGDDVATTVVVSPNGQTAYVTGYSSTRSSVDSVYATVAYNAATGAQEWVATYTGPAHGPDIAFSEAVSPTTGTVYVTGTAEIVAGSDYATVAYHG
jgi:WD40 repeat protein